MAPLALKAGSTRALLALTLVGAPGCVTHEVRAPQLDHAINIADKITDQIKALPAQAAPACPPIRLAEIPEDVVVDIKGDKVSTNEGGLLLLREYVKAREWAQGCSP